MEKCVFIGYPAGYKGWRFYNPVTKKIVICERAEFDERYFSLSKSGLAPPLSLIAPPAPEDMQAPDLGGEDNPADLQHCKTLQIHWT
jgi:hypothetical protein